MGYEYLRNESIIRSKTREIFGVGTVVTASANQVSVEDYEAVRWMVIGVMCVQNVLVCEFRDEVRISS